MSKFVLQEHKRKGKIKHKLLKKKCCTADLGFVDVVGGLSVLNAFLGGLKNKIKYNVSGSNERKRD